MIDNVASIATLNGLGSTVLRSTSALDFAGRPTLSANPFSIAMPTLQSMGLLGLVEQTIASVGLGSTIILPASLALADSPAWAQVIGNDVFPSVSSDSANLDATAGAMVEEAFAEIDESIVDAFLRRNPEIAFRDRTVEQNVLSAPIDRIRLNAAYRRFRSSATARFLVLSVVLLPLATAAIDQLLTQDITIGASGLTTTSLTFRYIGDDILH